MNSVVNEIECFCQDKSQDTAQRFFSACSDFQFINTAMAYLYGNITPPRKLEFLRWMNCRLGFTNDVNTAKFLALMAPVINYRIRDMANWINYDFTGKEQEPTSSHSYINEFHYGWYMFLRDALIHPDFTKFNAWFEGQSIVDLGCGSGYYSLISEALGAKRYVGVDRPTMVELFKGEVYDTGKMFFEMVDGNIDTWTEWEGVNTVLLCEVIHGKKDPTRWLRGFLEELKSCSRVETVIVHEIPSEVARTRDIPTIFSSLGEQLRRYCGGRLVSNDEMSRVAQQSGWRCTAFQTSFVHIAFVFEK